MGQPPPGEGYDRILRQVQDGPRTLTVALRWDRRLRRTVRWTVHGDVLLLRAPQSMALRTVNELLDGQILTRVLKQRASVRKRNDAELERRARALNQAYFDGALRWHTIRWVSNMTYRLGSCTTGGATDGDIRISTRLKEWPNYVLDYVIAHELAHREHPNHSPAFWELLARYPHTERARGFIDGVAHAEGSSADDLL